MIIFDRETNFARFDYSRQRSFIPFENLTLVEQQAEMVGLSKKATDIFVANKRAERCGCQNCRLDAEKVKEWYR